ncbi:MAG: diguanylate cyclase [Burkholderiales bacterium]|nr:diguanylate cyclase [Burkholderiales bacterium]
MGIHQRHPTFDPKGQFCGYHGTGRDINAQAGRGRHRTPGLYDALTELPNCCLLLDRLSQSVASAARHGNRGALMFIDLDNLRLLNVPWATA